MPISKKEEETYSREFWMFVGSVFLALSCLQLVVATSIPVWNAMFKTHIAPAMQTRLLCITFSRRVLQWWLLY